jgi:hypothetical protein
MDLFGAEAPAPPPKRRAARVAAIRVAQVLGKSRTAVFVDFSGASGEHPGEPGRGMPSFCLLHVTHGADEIEYRVSWPGDDAEIRFDDDWKSGNTVRSPSINDAAQIGLERLLKEPAESTLKRRQRRGNNL